MRECRSMSTQTPSRTAATALHKVRLFLSSQHRILGSEVMRCSCAASSACRLSSRNVRSWPMQSQRLAIGNGVPAAGAHHFMIQGRLSQALQVLTVTSLERQSLEREASAQTQRMRRTPRKQLRLRLRHQSLERQTLICYPASTQQVWLLQQHSHAMSLRVLTEASTAPKNCSNSERRLCSLMQQRRNSPLAEADYTLPRSLTTQAICATYHSVLQA